MEPAPQLPLEPPPLIAPAFVLPAVFTVAARPADLPPWPWREGPGALTKSMVLEIRIERVEQNDIEKEELV